MKLPKMGCIEAFAVIVDINQFTAMVNKGSDTQFVRDVLTGGITAIEDEGGEVVGFMGDAFYGLLPDAQAFFNAAIRIAIDLDQQCEWISENQADDPALWTFVDGGVGLKVTTEFGLLDIDTIHSRFLGEQRLFIGNAVNYAARIGAGGKGNRCLLGPRAANLVRNVGCELHGPFTIKGKAHEGSYEYFHLDLGNIWREGELGKSDDR